MIKSNCAHTPLRRKFRAVNDNVDLGEVVAGLDFFVHEGTSLLAQTHDLTCANKVYGTVPCNKRTVQQSACRPYALFRDTNIELYQRARRNNDQLASLHGSFFRVCSEDKECTFENWNYTLEPTVPFQDSKYNRLTVWTLLLHLCLSIRYTCRAAQAVNHPSFVPVFAGSERNFCWMS